MSLRLLAPEEKGKLVVSLAENFEMAEASLSGYEVVECESEYWAVSSAVLPLPLRKLKVESVGLLLARGREVITPTVAALQLFCEQHPDSLVLSRGDALSFIDRKAVAVNVPDGRKVVFYGGHALDLGEVRDGNLIRVRS